MASSSSQKDLWLPLAEARSTTALMPMQDFGVNASAKKNVASLTEGPVFVKKSIYSRIRNQLQPYISSLLEMLDHLKPQKLPLVPSDEVYEVMLESVMTTLVEHYMAYNNLRGNCDDLKKFYRDLPRGDLEEIKGLLTEFSVASNAQKVCGIFNDKAVDTPCLDLNASFTLMVELLNSFSLEPDIWRNINTILLLMARLALILYDIVDHLVYFVSHLHVHTHGTL